MSTEFLVAVFLVGLLTVGCARGGQPLDDLRQSYAPYVTAGDGLGFPLKIKAISASPYKFWRGTKDLFYLWAKEHCRDWLGDRDCFVPIHGDLHFGNIGTYPVQPWGSVAFGEVDFDDACTAPFQLQLLDGVITLKLVAQQNEIHCSTDARQQLAGDLLEAYAKAISNPSAAADIQSAPTLLRHVLESRVADYSSELSAFTADHHFRTKLTSSKGTLKEILRSATQRRDEFADGLAATVKNDPAAAKLFRYQTHDEFHDAIIDIAQRTRLGSAGSQGLRKYLILLRRPLNVTDSDVIVYFKQAIPAAAERSGAIPKSELPAGRRLKESIDALTDPPPLLNSWCDIGGESYWVGLKEPWSQEIDPDDIRTLEDLRAAARLWGSVAGNAQRRWAMNITTQRYDALRDVINERSDAFVTRLNDDYTALIADPAATRATHTADEAIAAAQRR